MDSIDKLFEELNKKPETFKEFISDIWFNICFYSSKWFKEFPRQIKYFFCNIWKYRENLWNDFEFDFSYLLSLEYRKISLMAEYFKNSDIAEDNKKSAKELYLAKHLLEIILEINDQEVYVNTRNIGRFKSEEFIKIMEDFKSRSDKTLYGYLLQEIRKQKALYLYSVLRYRKIETWWD